MLIVSSWCSGKTTFCLKNNNYIDLDNFIKAEAMKSDKNKDVIRQMCKNTDKVFFINFKWYKKIFEKHEQSIFIMPSNDRSKLFEKRESKKIGKNRCRKICNEIKSCTDMFFNEAKVIAKNTNSLFIELKENEFIEDVCTFLQ